MFRYFLLMMVLFSIATLSFAHTEIVWSTVYHGGHNHGDGLEHKHRGALKIVYIDFDPSNTSGSHPHIRDYDQDAYTSEYVNSHPASYTQRGGLQTFQTPTYFTDDSGGEPPPDTTPVEKPGQLPTSTQTPRHEVNDPETGKRYEFIPGIGLIDKDDVELDDEDVEELRRLLEEFEERLIPESQHTPETQRTPEAQRTPETQRTPEAQHTPETQRTPEAQHTPETQRINRQILQEIATGERPPVEVSDPKTGRTHRIDAPTANRILSSEAVFSSHPLQPLRVTEYMVRDWSRDFGAVLPQWIEIHNPNTEPVNLKGYTFEYATRRFANHPYTRHTVTLDEQNIPAGGVVLLVTYSIPHWKVSGIEAGQIYNLKIPNVLKRGWVLSDAGGREIQRIGRKAFNALTDPVAPPHQDGVRVSHVVVPSETPQEAYSYAGGIGTPGYYKQPAPAAPSAPRRKKIGLWGELKRKPHN